MARGGLSRRCFLLGAAAGGGCSRRTERIGEQATADLAEVSLADLSAWLGSGRLTAARATTLYLERIATLDKAGPAVNAVIELNPDAESIAASLDAERRAGRARGPLHGVPVLVKDNIDTADRMQTTAGSLALEGSIAARDAAAVERLRAAGAVLLGKTNLSEWANFRGRRSTSGWSARGGLTRNPYALDHSACGSSSGSGAATAASLCAAAVGTETNGSIVCPSSVNGLAGIKPTVGLVSQAGIIPISRTQDTAGPMARSVRDACLLLDGMADPAAIGPGRGSANYASHCRLGGLRGARLGVARQATGRREDVDAVFEEALAALRAEGAELVEVERGLPEGDEWNAVGMEVMLYEFKDGIERYLAGLSPEVERATLADLIAFNRANADRELAYFGQELFEAAEEKGPLTSPEYLRALETMLRMARAEGIDRALDGQRLDALIAPATGPSWPIDLGGGDRGSGGSSSWAARAGYPNITVPMGLIGGLPLGVSFFGRAWSEPRLIEFAYGYEQATRARRPPGFSPAPPNG